MERSRGGSVFTALGGIVLAIAVFLPWYGMSLTTRGISFAQQMSAQVVSQFGNEQLQSYLGGLHTDLNSLAGHQLAAFSAHQVLKTINVLLLIIAAVAVLLALGSLAREDRSQNDTERGLIVLLGVIAAFCVAYRMIDPPGQAYGLFTLSLREGSWLSLLGSLAIVAGGLWPVRGASLPSRSARAGQDLLADLSGWTPSN